MPPSDVGRKFLCTRVLEVVVTLTEDDVENMVAEGMSADETAEMLASMHGEELWTVVHEEVVPA